MKIYGIFFTMAMYTTLDAVQGKLYLPRKTKSPEKKEKNQEVAEVGNSLPNLRFLPRGKTAEENTYNASTQNLYSNNASDSDNELLQWKLQINDTRRPDSYFETGQEGEEDASFWERELRGSGVRLRRLVKGVVGAKVAPLHNEHQGHKSRRIDISQEHDGGNNDSLWGGDLRGSGRRRPDLDEKGEYTLDRVTNGMKVDDPFERQQLLGVQEDLRFREGGLQGGDDRDIVEHDYSEFWERELQQS